MEVEHLVIEKDTQVEEGKNPFKDAVCLNVRFHALGIKRKVGMAAVQIDADKDYFNLTKDILKSETYKEIGSLYSKVKAFLNAHCIPAPNYKESIWLLPNVSVTEVDEYLEYIIYGELPPLVSKFLEEYDAVKAAAALALKESFNPGNYPDAEKVRASFGIEKRYMTYSTPDNLKSINPNIFKRELENGRKEVLEMIADTKTFLRQAMRDLVAHIADRLSYDDEGNKKRFHASSITKLTEFLDNFNNRNIWKDNELSAIVETAKSLVEGVDPEQLRSNDDLRLTYKSKFEEVKGTIDTLMEDKPKRRITLNEADV